MKRVVSAVLFVIFSTAPLVYAEELKPVEYSEDEFQTWMMELRRFEIISLGSTPFTLVLSAFGYGLVRFAMNGFSSSYAPWPFSSSISVPMTSLENITVFGIALAGSAVIGLVDFAIMSTRNAAGDSGTSGDDVVLPGETIPESGVTESGSE